MGEEENVEEGMDGGRVQRMRVEAEKISEAVLPRAAREHLLRAGTEMLLAFDSMVPRERIPDDVRQHYVNAKRETLMIWKCLLDAQLNLIREMERKPEAQEPGLKKIELD